MISAAMAQLSPEMIDTVRLHHRTSRVSLQTITLTLSPLNPLFLSPPLRLLVPSNAFWSILSTFPCHIQMDTNSDLSGFPLILLLLLLSQRRPQSSPPTISSIPTSAYPPHQSPASSSQPSFSPFDFASLNAFLTVLLEQVIASNPQLQAMGPQVRQMMTSPMFRQMM